MAVSPGGMDEADALQLVLKLHLYGEWARLGAGNDHGGQLPPSFGRFTSRKVRRLLVSESANPEAMTDQVSEFFGVTSHRVADLLEELSREGVLEFEGTGLRGVRVYRWRGALSRGTLATFLRTRSAFAGKLAFGLDLHHIQRAFGAGPFTLSDFVDLHLALRRERSATRYGILQHASLARSSRFAHFLRSRLAGLHALGFLVEDAGRHRVSDRGLEALLLLDLFGRGMEWRPRSDPA